MKLSSALRHLLAQLKLELDQMAMRISEADAVLNRAARDNADSQRLMTILGLGPITATALIAAIGARRGFRKIGEEELIDELDDRAMLGGVMRDGVDFAVRRDHDRGMRGP